MSALVSVRLAGPGRAGEADGVGVAAERVGEAADLAGRLAAALDQREQPGERRPVALTRPPSNSSSGSTASGSADRRYADEVVRSGLDRHDLGDAVDPVLHDPLDAGLEGDGGRRAGAAGADERAR